MTRLTVLPLIWVAGPPIAAGLLLLIAGRRRQSLAVSIGLVVCMAAAAFMSLAAADVFYGPASSPGPEPITVIIRPGTPLPAVARLLEEARIVEDPGRFSLAARLTFTDRAVKSGRYRFTGGQGMLSVLRRLVEGATGREMVTIPEGLRASQVASIASSHAGVDSAAFMALVGDSLFIAAVLSPVEGETLPQTLEGYLLPDTHNIYWQMPVREVVRLMVGQFDALWRDRLAEKARLRGMSRHEVVTLASIIEREAATDSERPIVSAVFHNRLRSGMRLESCATVLFALGRYKPRLYERDLQVDSPYNTYRVRGLPPGPIANAGRSSLLAAVQPADAQYLYFVARGDGTHTFSTTYSQHLLAKNRSGDGVLVGGRAARERGTGGPPSDPPPGP